MTAEYNVSMRCYYGGPDNYTQHRQTLKLKDIAKWIEAYKFTHPGVKAITVKVWLTDEEEEK